MKNILKILLVLLFALIVFMPTDKLSPWLYWSLFFMMFGVLILFYRFSYWVSESSIETEEEIKFSTFCGKVPPMESEDLVRGRLIVTSKEVALYQKEDRKGATSKVKKVWSVPIDEIEQLSSGKVVGFRKGIVLSLAGEREGKFTISQIKKKRPLLIEALGWSDN